MKNDWIKGMTELEGTNQFLLYSFIAAESERYPTDNRDYKRHNKWIECYLKGISQ